VRISRDSKGEGLGVDRQERDCRDWCARHGWRVGEVYEDNDVSAYGRKKRPAFTRMVDDLKNGVRDGIVVWAADRLSRRPAELESVIDIVEAIGAPVASVTSGDYDLGTEDGRLVARIVGAVARKEGDALSRRIRRKHVELAEEGKLAGGGRRPFGFTADRMHVNKREAKLVREATERVLAGESVRGIARDWAARGITPADSDGQWWPSNLRRMLLSPRIAGLRDLPGVGPVDAVWPGIITPDERVRLQAVFADENRRTLVRGTKYPLSGFVFCQQCGERMVSRPTMEGVRKYCCARIPGRPGACGKTTIVAEPVEQLAEAAVVAALESSAAVRQQRSTRAAQKAAAAKGEPRDPVAWLAEIDDRESKLAEQAAQGKLAPTMLTKLAAAIENERAQARSALAAEESAKPVVADPESVARSWPKLSFEKKRAVMGVLVDRVVIGPGRRGFNRFDPSRVRIDWK
jgi:DNA invertase Pin-like site-specific DNA recombinase